MALGEDGGVLEVVGDGLREDLVGLRLLEDGGTGADVVDGGAVERGLEPAPLYFDGVLFVDPLLAEG